MARSAIIIKPSTLLHFHNALKKRNPRYGCPRIVQQIKLAFGLDKDTVRRVLAVHYKPDPASRGPSWLTTPGHAKNSLWSIDLFSAESIALRTHWIMVVMDQYTRSISSDNDPLFQYHPWKANLRVLEIEEIKSLPHVPMSHPFVELNDYRWKKHCRGLFELPTAA